MTTDERLDALERELGRSSQANRILRFALDVIIVASITGLTLTGQERATVVRERALVVEGEDGAARAILGLEKDGVALTLADTSKRPRAVLRLGADGAPSLVLSDQQARFGFERRLPAA